MLTSKFFKAVSRAGSKSMLRCVVAALIVGGLFAAAVPSDAWAARRSAARTTPQAVDKVDLNSATDKALQELPGVGAVTSKKIIAGRPYKTVSDLSKAGLTDAEIAKIKSLVTVKAPVEPKDAGKSVVANPKDTTKAAATKEPATKVADTKAKAAAEPKTAAPKTATAPKTAAAKVDLNTATVEQLQEIPGIGDVYSKKIVAGRPYKSIDGLEAAGVPTAVVAKIRPLVTVAKPAPAATKSGATSRTSTAKSGTEKTAPTKEAATPPQKGMVWVNTDSKIYHKEGSRWYGHTKEGKWMTEADAIKGGFVASKE